MTKVFWFVACRWRWDSAVSGVVTRPDEALRAPVESLSWGLHLHLRVLGRVPWWCGFF